VEPVSLLDVLVPAPSHPGSVAILLGAAFLVLTYAVYPAVLFLRARLAPRPVRCGRVAPLPSVTCIVAAHDEGDRLVRKVENLLALDYPPDRLEVVVADDGSTDGAPARAAALDPSRVRVVSTPRRGGKPAALVRAAATASSEVLLLCDVRQRFDAGAARALVAPFADAEVGVVTGQLRLDGARGPGAYWRYETAIRVAQGRSGSVMGATGAIYAVRRALFPLDLPPETILDDVYVPLIALRAGRRVAYAEGALAFDRELDVEREFVRKVRTLAGVWQLLALFPELRNPFLGGLQWRFFWHKEARLLSPAALGALLAGSVAAPGHLATALLALQLAVYALAAIGHLAHGRGGRAVTLCHTFVALNVAAAVAPFAFALGRARVTWVRTGSLGAGIE
jgi:cellulose synthase/poly-beta-1,6-N-acetylglucosamine synthase-like glycosyltransferase